MNAYSMDLRTRMFNYSLTHTVRHTAAVFQVSPNTVQQLRQLFVETGQLTPRPAGAARPRAVSAEGELFLQVLLRQDSDLTLEELRAGYADTYGVTVSLGAMHDTLKRLGITRKKSPPTTRKRPPSTRKLKRNAITNKSILCPSTSDSISMKPEPA